ncbi:MAG: energy-coupling factor transporter transmembrane protein EcfT [Calditrichia bacterium]
MRHEFLDHHRAGNSLIHRADPRLKFLIILFYIFMVVSIPYPLKRFFLPVALLPLTCALLSGVSLGHYLSKLLRLYPMVFFISFLLPFFPSESGIMGRFGFLTVYQTGLQNFILINVKSVLIIFMSIVMMVTTDFSLMLKGLEKLRLPSLMIMVLSFMYRFIFLLIDEAERMQMAYASRYIRLPFFTRLRILAQQIGVLFIRTFERGERVYQAMDARGFSGKIYTLNQIRWKRLDTILLSVFVGWIGVSFFLMSTIRF